MPAGISKHNQSHWKHSVKTKKKMSKARKGRERTEKQKNQIKEIQKNNIGNEYNLGRHHTKATRKKMKETHKRIGTKFPNQSGYKHSKTTRIKIGLGNKGKRKTLEAKIKISKSLEGKMPKNIMQEGKFSNVKRGWYQIGNKKIFFRSKWEANYALYLNFLVKQEQIKKWEYEKDTFIFEKIKFGTRSYTPDFKIYNNSNTIEYHEVKGWMDKKSKTKLNRMRIYYPKIKLILIEKDSYNDIKNKVGKMLNFY